MSRRILIAGLFHETHSFVEDSTVLSDFDIRRGAEMLACAGDASPLGGVLEYADGEAWEVMPAIDYRATPSGPVKDEVFEMWWREFEGAWHPACDAIYLILHGAMVSETILDVEGELLRRIRVLVGNAKPIFGVYDLHANFSPAMAANADCLVAYRENPHSDAREAAIRAAKLLTKCLGGVRPCIHLRQVNILLPPTATGTADEPMCALGAMARSMEGSDVWAVNVAAGFAFADTPDSGLSFQVVTTGLPERAGKQLAKLERLAKSLKGSCFNDEESIESVMPRLRKPVEGLTVLVEPSDNIGGGAPGDGTGCLRALVEQRIEKAAVCINDPEAVARLAKVRVGGGTRLIIGGKGSRLDPGPLELEVELIARSDGRFELEDKQSHLASMVGDYASMGDCALVRHAGVTLLLTSNKTAPFDLGQWRSQGIAPEELNVIVVKAAVAHRRAYDPITARSFRVDTPGPCSSQLDRLPYRQLRGGINFLDFDKQAS